MFNYEDETPYHIYTLKQTFERHIYLLLLLNSENSQYAFIKDFNKFMTNKIKNHGKKHFCRNCLQCYFSSKVLECHVRNCLANNHTKSVLLPEEGQYVSF